MNGKSLIHLNGNLLCAIDLETTGFNPKIHDIWQIAILPLDSDIRPLKMEGLSPFYIDIKPDRPQNADPEAISKDKLEKVLKDGLDSELAQMLLEKWFNKLQLAINKKICPLACNWPFDRSFLIEWLGLLNFEAFFHPWYRDVLAASLYSNDRADVNAEPVPYAKSSLAYLCSTLKVENISPHDALSDCVATAEVYRLMLKQLF